VALARPKNALVASLNFHPGHFSHLVASYRLLADSGYAPHLYVHRSFNAMDVEGEFRKINRPGELRGLGTVDVAVFWFPSLRNVLEILRLRLRFGTKVVYVNHEPWDSFASYRASGFGLRQIAKVWLISLVNLSVILLSSGVVLPSSGAYALYRQKFAWLNRNYRRIPLLFDDEEKGGTDHGREFVSYVGTVAADHAFDRFVEFVDAAVTNEWLPGLRFLIATRSEIPERERAILARHLPSGTSSEAWWSGTRIIARCRAASFPRRTCSAPRSSPCAATAASSWTTTSRASSSNATTTRWRSGRRSRRSGGTRARSHEPAGRSS
jgi:hypothetical protein